MSGTGFTGRNASAIATRIATPTAAITPHRHHPRSATVICSASRSDCSLARTRASSPARGSTAAYRPSAASNSPSSLSSAASLSCAGHLSSRRFGSLFISPPASRRCAPVSLSESAVREKPANVPPLRSFPAPLLLPAETFPRSSTGSAAAVIFPVARQSSAPAPPRSACRAPSHPQAFRCLPPRPDSPCRPSNLPAFSHAAGCGRQRLATQSAPATPLHRPPLPASSDNAAPAETFPALHLRPRDGGAAPHTLCDTPAANAPAPACRAVRLPAPAGFGLRSLRPPLLCSESPLPPPRVCPHSSRPSLRLFRSGIS